MVPKAFSVAMPQRTGFRLGRNDVPITGTVSYVTC